VAATGSVTRRTGSRRLQVAAAALPVAFLAVFFVWPLVAILGRGLAPDGTFDLVGAFSRVADARLGGVVWFTVWQAIASTVLTLVLGLPGAYVLSRLRFRGRDVLRAAVTVPFVLPTVVVATAFLGLLGPASPVNDLLRAVAGDGAPVLDLRRTVPAVLVAHAFFNYAVVVRTVGGLWAHLDPRLEDAARTLGASRWRTFVEVTWPLLRPAVAAAAAIVFLFTFTSFGVVLILGGPGLATIEVEIYRATAQRLDLSLAAVLSLLQLGAVVAALAVSGRLTRRVGRQRLSRADRAVRPLTTAGDRWLLRANLAVMTVLLAAPLLVLVSRSFRVGDAWSLAGWRALVATPSRGAVLTVTPWEAALTSLAFAAAATVLALVVGGLAALAVTVREGRTGRTLDTLLMLPLGASAVTLGFGFLLALSRPPLDLRTSPLLVPIAQALVAVPFVVRTLLPVLRSIDVRLREAAAALGAPPARVWREVDLPIVRRATTVAAWFAFAISLGEFGATVFVARSTRPTLPIAIFRLLGQPGALNLAQAMALATVLMLLTAGAVLAFERVRGSEGTLF
jgi:thiamine transport system permease protein